VNLFRHTLSLLSSMVDAKKSEYNIQAWRDLNSEIEEESHLKSHQKWTILSCLQNMLYLLCIFFLFIFIGLNNLVIA
jgi:hypothetical protein